MSSLTPKRVIQTWWPLLLLLSSLAASSWYYIASDLKIERMLSSHKWQSIGASEIEINAKEQLTTLHGLKYYESTSQVIFLPNKTFSRFTHLVLESNTSTTPLQIHISETGTWQVSGKYLQTEIVDISDVISGNNELFTEEELEYLRHYYIIDSKQSRKLDVIDSKSILLTSLNNGSSIIVAQ